MQDINLYQNKMIVNINQKFALLLHIPSFILYKKLFW